MACEEKDCMLGDQSADYCPSPVRAAAGPHRSCGVETEGW